MESASLVSSPPSDSSSKPSFFSPSKKLPRKTAPKYSSCLLYNVKAAKEKLTGLAIATCNPSVEVETDRDGNTDESATTLRENDQKEFIVSDKMSCNFCQTEFSSRREQKDHYRSDWHRYNLKQRIKGLTSVSEESFEIMSGNISSLSGSESDGDGGTDTESDSIPRSKPLGIPSRLRQSRRLSGSDSDSESGSFAESLSARKYPKIYLRNSSRELISIYRCVLYHKKNPLESQSELMAKASSLPDHMTWAVIMAGGGHFAGAVFENGSISHHKTFHRYVVRAKRGSAQGSRDSQGNAPKSGGATLRRYNEAALMQEIQDLIASWDDAIKKCDLIFLRAPSFNRQIFYGGKNPPFHKNDPRIRIIPFPTRRATNKEVRRVHEMLASIECYGEEEDIREFVPMSPRRHLSPDSGNLEPVTDSDRSGGPKKKQQKNKAGLSPLASSSSNENQPTQTEENSSKSSILDRLRERKLSTSSVGSSISDMDLVELNEEISTLSLKLFEATRKPRRKKLKKKSGSPADHQVEGKVQDEEKNHFMNSLYTACKTGDVASLKNLLAKFSHPVNDQSKHSDGISILANQLDINTSEQTTNEKPDLVSPNENATIRSEDLPNQDVKSNDHTENKLSENESNNLEKGDEIKQKDNPMSNSQMTTVKLPSPVVTKDILNEQIGDSKLTLLHVACKEGHKPIIAVLLDAGADPAIRDGYGQSCYSSSVSKEVRNEFRRFMAKHPDKYDYTRAEVPGPLTEEMEQERRQKEAERKKVQRKVKQERLKEQKAEESKQRAEDMEKKRFLALSDREKRALAAEKRQMKTAESSGKPLPVLLRCWRCATDITGKIPFEYSNYKFCSTKCLKEHRLNPSNQKS